MGLISAAPNSSPPSATPAAPGIPLHSSTRHRAHEEIRRVRALTIGLRREPASALPGRGPDGCLPEDTSLSSRCSGRSDAVRRAAHAAGGKFSIRLIRPRGPTRAAAAGVDVIVAGRGGGHGGRGSTLTLVPRSWMVDPRPGVAAAALPTPGVWWRSGVGAQAAVLGRGCWPAPSRVPILTTSRGCWRPKRETVRRTCSVTLAERPHRTHANGVRR
jgi:hypothetical protein